MGQHQPSDTSTTSQVADDMCEAAAPSLPREEKSTAPITSGELRLPTSALIPVDNNSSGDNVVDTPLRKALHTAAALASVTVGTAAVATNYAACLESASLASSTEKGSDSSKPTEIVPEISTSKKRKATTAFRTASPKPKDWPFLLAPLTLPQSAPGVPMQQYNYSGGYPHAPSFPMPASTMGAPGTYHQMAAAIIATEVPPVFRDRPQRSGKWTREEEAYADLLIELFEKGHIDEKNGSTLRSCLSRKLHCAPMRISKKYAGKGIGKMVFLSKNHFRGTGDGIGSPAYNNNMQRLRQAEATFYKSCFPELALVRIYDVSSLQITQN